MMKHLTLLCAMATVVALAACKKDQIALDELTTNPFDADYDGAAVFTYVDDTTTIETKIQYQSVNVIFLEFC